MLMVREEEIKQYCADQGFPYGACSSLSSMKAQIASDAIRWADAHPRKVFVVVRCEEHDDYIEKVFVDKTKANEYCNKFEGNPNEYGRYYEEMEVTL